MKLIVLGSEGLLGNYIRRYFTGKLNVVCPVHDRISTDIKNKLAMQEIKSNIGKNDIVINCIGLLKPRLKNVSTEHAFAVNSIFPYNLSVMCKEVGSTFIHICSDCVYSGSTGGYTEYSPIDGTDLYSITKSTRNLGCTIRTSFIGRHKSSTHCGLLNWLLVSNKEVQGYTNCIWNGVTCLELCECIHRMIENNVVWTGTRHLFSKDIISKYELCRLINEIYGLNLQIKPHTTKSIEGQPVDVRLDRSLATAHSDHSSILPTLSIREQIVKQYEYDRLF